MTRRTPIPCIAYFHRIGAKKIRVFFNDGLILETSLPVRRAPAAVRMTDDWGTGLEFGPFDVAPPLARWGEIGSHGLYLRPGKVLRHGSSEQLRRDHGR
jgi:hypothetical protein